MIPRWLIHAGLQIAGHAAERFGRALAESLASAVRPAPPTWRAVPAARAADYAASHPGAVDAGVFVRVARAYARGHPEEAPHVSAALAELGRAAAAHPGCTIFVHPT